MAYLHRHLGWILWNIWLVFSHISHPAMLPEMNLWSTCKAVSQKYNVALVISEVKPKPYSSNPRILWAKPRPLTRIRSHRWFGYRSQKRDRRKWFCFQAVFHSSSQTSPSFASPASNLHSTFLISSKKPLEKHVAFARELDLRGQNRLWSWSVKNKWVEPKQSFGRQDSCTWRFKLPLKCWPSRKQDFSCKCTKIL